MGSMFRYSLKATRLGALAIGLCLLGGFTSPSHASSENSTQAFFLWGPIEQSLSDTGVPAPSFKGPSKAERLREELDAPVNRYAPSDKDWRHARGDEKGPTIFGARLSFSLHEGGRDELRIGAVRRGANRTYGPQFIFRFNGE